MKGVLDLHTITRCEMQTEPPLLSLSIGEDGGDLVLRAQSADECRVWVKAFVTASPNCQVSFVKGTPSVQGGEKTGEQDTKGGAGGGGGGGDKTGEQEDADVSREDGGDGDGHGQQVRTGPDDEGASQGVEQEDELTYDSDDNE